MDVFLCAAFGAYECIFRVWEKGAYAPPDPNFLFIGPYHADRPQGHGHTLEDAALRHAISVTGKTEEEFKSSIRGVLKEVRQCYEAENHPMFPPDDVLETVIVRDGCFVLEFIDVLIENDQSDVVEDVVY